MKKFILTMIIALMMVFSANAQIATENAKLFDNTYAGVEVGATTPLNFNSVFPVNTIAGVKFGKELTPLFGIEAEGQVFFNDNNVRRYMNTFVKGTNVGVNSTVNLSNLFGGYKGVPRVFEVKTNTGLGWLHYWNTYANDMTAKTSIDLTFNIGKTKAHSFVLTPGVYWNLTGGSSKVQFNKNLAQLAIMASYVYHFKTSNGTHYFKTYDVGAMYDEIARLNEELSKKPNEVIVEEIKTVEVPGATVYNASETYVFFAFDNDELDYRAKDALDKLSTNGVYIIDAYASNEGGTEYNIELSQRRADVVKEYLENRGARVDSATGHGVQFGITTGRVAVVTNK